MKHVTWIRIMASATLCAWLAAGCARSSDDTDHEHAGCTDDHPAHAPETACVQGTDHDHDHEQARKDDPDHEHGEACTADESPPAGVAFEIPASAQHLLGLTVVTAEKRHVVGVLRFPGRFEWMPGARRVYSATIPGVVELNVRPPQHVTSGDRLFTLHSAEWVEKKNAAHEAEAAWALLKAEADILNKRLTQLREAGARNAELEQQLALKTAEAIRAERTLQNATATMQAILAFCHEADGQLVFEARDTGVVERITIENGAWAETGAEVVCVTRADGLWFKADAVSSDMTQVHAGLQGFVEPLGKGLGRSALGTLELGLVADASIRIQPLYLLLPVLPAWALPGRAGVLHVVIDESEPESVALPQACVVIDGLQRFVFVRDAQDSDHFLKVEITCGASDGEWVQVTGINVGATVVLEGAYELLLAAPSSDRQEKAAGHFHSDGQFHEGEH